MRRKRPFGVSVIAVLIVLSAPANGIAIAFERWRILEVFAHRDVTIGAVAVTILALGIAIAIGLWRLQHWAWIGAMLWAGSMLAAGLVMYFTGDPAVGRRRGDGLLHEFHQCAAGVRALSDSRWSGA